MTWLRTLIWSLARNGMARDTDLRAQSQNATLIGQPCSSPTHFTFEPSAVGADTKAIALVSMHVRRPKPSVAARSSGKDMKDKGRKTRSLELFGVALLGMFLPETGNHLLLVTSCCSS